MIEVACGIMKNNQGLILMGLRSKDSEDGGLWEFPGGKREKNENIEDCLRREFMEELNLKITIDSEIYQNKYKNYLVRFFKGKIMNELDIKKNVHDDLIFIKKDSIKELKIFKEDLKVIKRI
jgi:8-oxo-dGTP diphosphatase